MKIYCHELINVGVLSRQTGPDCLTQTTLTSARIAFWPRTFEIATFQTLSRTTKLLAKTISTHVVAVEV